MGVLFAVGAVSGTVVAFQLGLLWPGFMRYAGGIIGMPFSLEGFAFFIEAIFIGIYLYGRERLTPLQHWLALDPGHGVGRRVGRVHHAGQRLDADADRLSRRRRQGHRRAAARRDVRAAVEDQVVHATLAAYAFTGFAAAAVCALARLFGDPRPTVLAGVRVAMLTGTVAVALQIVSGDVMARFDAAHEPAKFAAMEVRGQTATHVPLTVGGIPADGDIKYAIEIPGDAQLPRGR